MNSVSVQYNNKHSQDLSHQCEKSSHFQPPSPNKVVDLAKAKRCEHVLPASMKMLKNQSIEQLVKMLRHTLDRVDDYLFTLADRAINDKQQTLFFESMRAVRSHRMSIEKSVVKCLSDQFETTAKSGDQPIPSMSEDSTNLSLVEKDEVEKSLAVKTMIDKLQDQYKSPVRLLSLRINCVYQRPKGTVDSSLNPLSPNVLVTAFVNATLDLVLDIRVLLIIYKLLEQDLMTQLAFVYKSANELMAKQGVLPRLTADDSVDPLKKVSVQNRTVDHACLPTRSLQVASFQATEQDLKKAHQVFNSLQQLLHNASGNSENQSEQGEPLKDQELIGLLSKLQHQYSHLPVLSKGQHSAGQTPSLDLHKALGGLLANQSEQRYLARNERDAINLVSMLFDFILDDRNLASQMKALIGRLQIPVLKVAISDKTFFTKKLHPARQLLNEIARAALGWNANKSDQKDPLYEKIEITVETLLNDFDVDINLFKSLLQEFTEFVTADLRHASIIEKRIKEAEEGLARQEQVKQQVEIVLRQKLPHFSSSREIHCMVNEHWSKVMRVVAMKYGLHSANWQKVVQLIDQLAGLLAPVTDEQDQQGSKKLLAKCLMGFKQGFMFIGGSQQEVQVHLDCIQQYCLQNLSKPIVHSQDHGTSNTLDDAKRLACLPKETGPAQMGVDPSDQPSESLVDEDEEIEEIVLTLPNSEDETDKPVSKTQALPQDDEFVCMVNHLEVGTWVEFCDNKNNRVRAKLAHVVSNSGKYIFVNRTGVKVAEKTQMGLAIEFRCKAVKILDQSMLFDRALNSVIGNLRKLKH